MINSERFNPPDSVPTFGFGLGFNQPLALNPKGTFHLKLESSDGITLVEWEKENTLTHLAPLFAAWLFSGKNSPITGVNGLVMGTGGDLAASTADRKKKTFIIPVAIATSPTVTFVDSADGGPTNQVDYKFVFGSGVGDNIALSEMGLAYLPAPASNISGSTFSFNQAAASYDPATDTSPPDIRGKDVLINYLPFAVINKPQGSTLTITWRLTF